MTGRYACGPHARDDYGLLWCSGTPVADSHLDEALIPASLLDVVDQSTALLWTETRPVTSPFSGYAERKRELLNQLGSRPPAGREEYPELLAGPGETISYADLKRIAAGYPSAHAECLARVTQGAIEAGACVTFDEDLTDGDTGAATTVVDGGAQFVLVCVPVTAELAAEAAARRDAGASTTVTVTVDLAVGADL